MVFWRIGSFYFDGEQRDHDDLDRLFCIKKVNAEGQYVYVIFFWSFFRKSTGSLKIEHKTGWKGPSDFGRVRFSVHILPRAAFYVFFADNKHIHHDSAGPLSSESE